MIDKEIWMDLRYLYLQGLTVSEISKLQNLDRKTVAKYIHCEKHTKYQRAPLAEKLITQYGNYINQRLEIYNLTSQKLFKEISKQGFLGKYGTVNNFVKSVKNELKTKSVLRFETQPGEQAQVDWAYFGDFYDRAENKTIRLCCFIMVLGFSRMRFIYFFNGDDTDNFLEAHNLAFEYFGGYTKEILYDNLKSVVIKRRFKLKDSDLNKRFLDFSGFYGFKPILARPYKPTTKGKVENTVDFVRTNFFEGESFYSLKDINKRAGQWLNEVNSNMHQGIHAIPRERFEKENLIVLTKKYDLSMVTYRNVHIDSFINYKTNRYSVPHNLAGKEISVKIIGNKMDIFYRDQIVANHTISTKKYDLVKDSKHFEGLMQERMKFTKPRPKIEEDPHHTVLERNLSIYEELVA